MRNIFRKGTVAALVIGLIVGVVGLSWAGYNIRQNSDGTTDFVDPSASIGNIGGNPEVRVGRQYFNIRITALANAATLYFVSPVSGTLFSAFAVQNSAPVYGMSSTITFAVMANLSPGVFVHPTTGGSILIPASTGQLGQIYYNQPFALGVSAARTPSDITKMQGSYLNVRRGGVIAIATGGEGTAANGGGIGEYDVWIIIDPR